MNLRTTARHEDDVWPVVLVWLPSGFLAYFLIAYSVEWVLLQHGYEYEIPVQIVGGGVSTTVQMTAAGYHGGQIGIFVMLAVWFFWWGRNAWKTTPLGVRS